MYSAPITRQCPTCFVVLIDRSGSMSERIVFGGQEMAKARAVALVANAFLDELLHRARRESGVCDYYDIAMLGYSGAGVESLLSPAGEWARPSRLAVRKVRRERLSQERELPSGRSVVAATEHNMWIEPGAEGATPMCAAMEVAAGMVGRWCLKHTKSYPPTVINITDGEASDGDDEKVRAVAERIRRTGTQDGGTLFINIHMARVSGSEKPTLFPSSEEELLRHRYARLLYSISSTMPAPFFDIIAAMREGSEGSGVLGGGASFRAMGYNCHIGDVAAMMNIGSVNSLMV